MCKPQQRRVIGEFPGQNGISPKAREAYQLLHVRNGPGGEMIGWLDWPGEYLNSEEYERLKETAEKIQEKNQAVIIVGIGGSYLTPQMIIHSEYGDFYNEIAVQKDLLRIYFAGCDWSPNKLLTTLELIGDDDFSVIYISKSGGTIEPAAAFRVLWEQLYEKYGEDANDHVYAITDAQKGTAKRLADEHGWKSFVIPDEIGGRYSGLTAVGLLPVAIAGIDTDSILEGAIEAMEDYANNQEGFASQYAQWRYDMYMFHRYSNEFMALNTPYMMYFGEWWKQLFGESEGKERRGLFPTSGVFPTDLHSIGQYLQQGTKGLIIETFLIRDLSPQKNPKLVESILYPDYRKVSIPSSNLDDNLELLEGKTFVEAADASMQGAYKAHTAGGNQCSIIHVGNTLKDIGYLMYSMFEACAISATMLGVNPFDQPGVELHKEETRRILLEEN